MSRNSKIILGSLGGTTLLCIVLAIIFFLVAEWQNRRNLANMHIEDPATIAQVANTMADYNLPPKYNEALVSRLLTTNVLYIFVAEDTPDNLSYPRITLVQFPPEKYPSALAAREKLRQAGPEIETEDGTLEVTDAVTTLIRGQQVGLTYYKWLDDNAEEHRAIVSDVFKGKKGFLQLKIEGSARGWNEAEIDAFIQSIR